MLQDRYGRYIDTLRISVTDRCNFRCRYCLPPEGLPWVPAGHLLSFEQIVAVARAFVDCGGRKLRLTGGEPLLRKGIERLIAALATLSGVEDLGLTTNGSLLANAAERFKAAGLQRINISLDTLNPLRFQWICLRDACSAVQKGIDAACACGLQVKLNAVVLHGITETEVVDLVTLGIARGIAVRFIEFMPLCGSGWRPDLHVPMATVRAWIAARWTLTPLPRGSDPAATYQIDSGPASVGFIESLSHPFCDRCSRLRLTANGRIRPCLFSPIEYDLVPVLHDDALLRERLRAAVAGKPAGHAAVPLPAWDGRRLPAIQQVGG